MQYICITFSSSSPSPGNPFEVQLGDLSFRLSFGRSNGTKRCPKPASRGSAPQQGGALFDWERALGAFGFASTSYTLSLHAFQSSIVLSPPTSLGFLPWGKGWKPTAGADVSWTLRVFAAL